MKIPNDLVDREAFYDDVIRKCLVSRQDRVTTYQQLRSYYLFGAASGSQAPYNKIQPTIQLLRSFIYSAETTKYNIHLGATVSKTELAKVPVLSAEINDLWHDSDTDLILTSAVDWSFVYNSVIVKALWNGGVHAYVVEPGNFGVYNEGVGFLERQEAVVECYTITRAELERQLGPHPHKASILQWIAAGQSISDEGFPAGLQNLMLSQSYPAMVGGPFGGVTNNGSSYDYRPQVDAELVDMYELYLWDDDEDDYRMVTRAAPGVTIFDRMNLGVPKRLPYVKLCPEPLPHYFWGQSFTAKLVPLQDWRTERIEQLRKLMSLQIKPPKSLSGYRGINEEKLQALNRVGGILAGDMGAKVDVHKPDIPEKLFAEIHEIDAMFEDMAGISHVMQGKGDSGVRAKGHADLLARLSSARPKQTALAIEDALEKLATLMLRLLQQHSDQRFVYEQDDKPVVFIAKQFTSDYVVKVDAHSSSPIFVEDRKQDAMTLLEAHAIDRETLLEIFDPPGVQMLKERLKKIEAGEAKQQQMQAQQEQAELAAKQSKMGRAA